MKNIPLALIYSRLAIGLLILALSFSSIDNYALLITLLLSAGILTDILDGIIARQLGISTQHLRRLDSLIDQLFFLLVALAAFVKHPDFFAEHAGKLAILFGIEACAYLVCLLKFRKEIATHAIASKIWTLVLFATLLQLLTTGNSALLFEICFYLGLITRLEIIGIILLLRQWAHDVPSVYHAVLLRRGKAIVRHSLFNG